MCTRYPIINRVSELKVHIELTRFVQPEKIEIDANERAVNEKSQYCFFVCTTFDSFLNDFNDSLSMLFSDSSFKEKISSIKSNKDSVNDLMKELKNPPDEYKEAYDELKDLYDSYLNIVNIATDPSGSLQTYTSNFNSADSDVAQKIQSIQIYIQ